MADKLPQPTAVLVRRLRRVAKWLDSDTSGRPDMAARANTCWQAAARLEEAAEELSTMPDILTAEDDI